MGTSFANRIYIASKTGDVWYSDIALFGQFRTAQQFSPYSSISAILPAGDRLFVIGSSSTEVWYESQAGPALLEQDIVNGSDYGSTFVAVGDGVIFGLWNEGFGFYDGTEHKYIPVPDYIQTLYLGEVGTGTKSAVKVKDWYYLAIRRWQTSSDNNVIIMFNFRTGRWFVVEDSVRDLAYWNEEVIGVDNSVYVMFRGDTFAESVIHTTGIVSSSIIEQRTVNDIRILMEPSSVKSLTLTVSGEERDSQQVGDGIGLPMKGINTIEKILPDYWNKTNAVYGTDWQSPGDVFLQLRHKKPVPGFYHRVKIVFPAGHLVRVKGLEVTYSAATRPEGR